MSQPAPPPAPGSYLHDGFYLRMALGLSNTWGRAEGNGLALKTTGMGPAWDFALGGTPARGLTIGGGYYGAVGIDTAVNGTATTSSSYSEFRGTKAGATFAAVVGPFVDVYPDPQKGLHFAAAAGIGPLTWHKGKTDAFVTLPRTTYTGTGMGVMVEAGYESWVGRQWSLGPLVRLLYASGTLSPDDTGSSMDFRALAVAALFGATCH